MKKILLIISLFFIVFSCSSQQTVQIDNKIYHKLNKAFQHTTLKRTATIIVENKNIAVYRTSDEDETLSIEFIIKNGKLSSASYEMQGAQNFENGKILWYANDIVKYSTISNRFGNIISIYYNGKLIKEIENE